MRESHFRSYRDLQEGREINPQSSEAIIVLALAYKRVGEEEKSGRS